MSWFNLLKAESILWEKNFITSGIEVLRYTNNATVEWTMKVHGRSHMAGKGGFSNPRLNDDLWQQQEGKKRTGGMSEWISKIELIVTNASITNSTGKLHNWSGNQITVKDGFMAGPAGNGGIAPAAVSISQNGESIRVSFNDLSSRLFEFRSETK
mgnify:CR=1 FL=1|tara:strand:- start:6945 stop:7409 length:465 start_codon:yes stop_codon:yes gene_type:complete